MSNSVPLLEMTIDLTSPVLDSVAYKTLGLAHRPRKLWPLGNRAFDPTPSVVADPGTPYAPATRFIDTTKTFTRI